jgi:lipopolysaccharide/colanic/teichoic acid biosynthesis glycosyltransferase
MKACNTESLLLDGDNLRVADDRLRIGLFPDSERTYFRCKRYLDRLMAAIMLVPGLPLIGVLILLIRLTSRGPGIYRQQRVGKDGRVFWMFKLRSMRMDAEATTGPVWTANGQDPRITPLGRVMRLLHLDELPQLFNVLWGEMSMIGPRPERPEFVNVLRREIPGYMDRLAVQPGVTGLAQINLPADTDLDSVRRKLLLDREYINTAGFLLDVRIALCTVLRMMGLRGGYAVRCLRLQRSVVLPAMSDTPHDADADQQEVPTPEKLAAIAASRRTACRQAKQLTTSSDKAAPSGNGQPTKKPHPPTPSIRDTLSDSAPPSVSETQQLQNRKAK